MIDLDAYFRRIGYDGPAPPVLETLDAIMEAHVRAVPFENLDVLLGHGVSLAPDALQDKLVARRRGGYCFEQNGLLLLVLQALGFTVAPLSARVRYQRPRDFTPPRTHLFLRVTIAGVPWAADVGVGSMSLTSPIRLDVEAEQATRHESRRIRWEDGRFFHQVRLGGDWHDVLEFTGEEMPPIDRELANWYTSAHPQSHFRHRLVVARALRDGGRIALLNREVSVRDRQGVAATRELATPDALLDVLARDFGLRLPRDTRFPDDVLGWASPAASTD